MRRLPSVLVAVLLLASCNSGSIGYNPVLSNIVSNRAAATIELDQGGLLLEPAPEIRPRLTFEEASLVFRQTANELLPLGNQSSRVIWDLRMAVAFGRLSLRGAPFNDRPAWVFFYRYSSRLAVAGSCGVKSFIPPRGEPRHYGWKAVVVDADRKADVWAYREGRWFCGRSQPSSAAPGTYRESIPWRVVADRGVMATIEFRLPPCGEMKVGVGGTDSANSPIQVVVDVPWSPGPECRSRVDRNDIRHDPGVPLLHGALGRMEWTG